MSLLETLTVGHTPSDERLVGAHIDWPRPGEWSERSALHVAGWVLGRTSAAVAIEVLHGDTVVRREPLGVWRPDLVTAFPGVAEAGRGGFELRLELAGLQESVLDIRAVLADQSRVSIGSIKVAGRWREEAYHAAAPLVSVVIPCYDQARYLPEAIESVLTQSYPHLELIVVDDGSHDNTAAVAGRYPGVRLVRQANAGLAAARNAGLRESNGACLVFLDADDRLAPTALADGLTALADHPEAAFVVGRYRDMDAFGVAGSEHQAAATADNGVAAGAVMGMDPGAMLGAVMYRRPAFEGVGVFNEKVGESAAQDLNRRMMEIFPAFAHAAVIGDVRRPARPSVPTPLDVDAG